MKGRICESGDEPIARVLVGGPACRTGGREPWARHGGAAGPGDGRACGSSLYELEPRKECWGRSTKKMASIFLPDPKNELALKTRNNAGLENLGGGGVEGFFLEGLLLQ